ncbi:MAG: hypothetical protein MK229_05450, partial [Nitrososphaerales archaeon]|nr:hypothetical protein [Nitrososphaerales archaeon]
MAKAATLDVVVGKLEELNKSVERGFKAIGPPIEASEQTTSEGLGEIETYTSETANSMTGPAIDTWTGME